MNRGAAAAAAFTASAITYAGILAATGGWAQDGVRVWCSLFPSVATAGKTFAVVLPLLGFLAAIAVYAMFGGTRLPAGRAILLALISAAALPLLRVAVRPAADLLGLPIPAVEAATSGATAFALLWLLTSGR